MDPLHCASPARGQLALPWAPPLMAPRTLPTKTQPKYGLYLYDPDPPALPQWDLLPGPSHSLHYDDVSTATA